MRRTAAPFLQGQRPLRHQKPRMRAGTALQKAVRQSMCRCCPLAIRSCYHRMDAARRCCLVAEYSNSKR